MFNRKSTANEPHPLDETIASLISGISGTGSEEETNVVNSLKVLMELRAADKAAAKRPTMSPDAIASITGNLLGIGLILGFEKANVITSKSLGFVTKIKI